LVIFVVTILITLYTDLLLGVGAGILMKFIFHIINGAPLRSLFKARYEYFETETEQHVKVKDSAVFSNLIGYKRLFARFKPGKKVIINFSDARIVDHTFMEALHHVEEERHQRGDEILTVGFDNFRALSHHPLAARKYDPGMQSKVEIRLTPRQLELRRYAEQQDFNFFPQKARTAAKYKDFPIAKGNQIQYEENILSKFTDTHKIEFSEISR
jgi:MFS superfamily sulfate permease-like transporter